MTTVSSQSAQKNYYMYLDRPFDCEKVELYKFVKNEIYNQYKNPIIYDFGCGLGHVTNYLGGGGFDINEYAISRAKKYFPKNRFYCTDITQLNINKLNLPKADAVTFFNVIEHIPDVGRNRLLEKIIPGILKKSGLAIFSLQRIYFLPNIINSLLRRKSIFDPTHIHNWTENQFISVINNNFEIIKIQNLAGFTRLTKYSKYIKNETLLIARLKNN